MIFRKLRKHEKHLLLFGLLIKGLMYAGLVGFHFVSQNNTHVVLGVLVLFVYGIAVLYMILSLGQLFVYCMEHVSITCMMLRALGLGIVLDQYGKDVTDQKTPFKGRMKICTLIALFVIELLAVLLKLNLAPVSYITYVCAFVCMISMILFEVFLCGPIGKQYHDQKQVSGGNGNR